MSHQLPSGLAVKDPNDIVDYRIDWSDELKQYGDTISTSVWTVQEGLTKVADPNTGTMDPFTNTAAIVWVSGGTAGAYTAHNRITTAQGRRRDRTIIITVKEL